jgi:glycosyltransferase involved in cell wall biosynthesis
MSELLIAVDALAINRRSAGGFTVLQGLLPELVKICDYQFVLYTVSNDIQASLGTLDGRVTYVYPPKWVGSIVTRCFWQQFFFPGLIKDAGCKLLYSATGCPEIFTTIPVVSHQQNLWPFTESQLWWTVKNRAKSFLRRRVAKIALKTSKANIFISDYLRDCANNLFPQTRGKNFTVHNAIPNPKDILSTSIGTEWIDKDFCVAVGSIVIHKNYENLLKAFKIVSEKFPDLYLVIVGNNTSNYGVRVKNLCKEFKMDNKVFFAGSLKLEQIFYLYKRAVFSINVSLLEGFGLPVLESLAMSCPVVCSDIPAYKEIAADSAIYCDSKKPENIAEKAIQLYADEDQREKMAVRGIEQAAKFSWNDSAEKLLAIFNNILRI